MYMWWWGGIAAIVDFYSYIFFFFFYSGLPTSVRWTARNQSWRATRPLYDRELCGPLPPGVCHHQTAEGCMSLQVSLPLIDTQSNKVHRPPSYLPNKLWQVSFEYLKSPKSQCDHGWNIHGIHSRCAVYMLVKDYSSLQPKVVHLWQVEVRAFHSQNKYGTIESASLCTFGFVEGLVNNNLLFTIIPLEGGNAL